MSVPVIFIGKQFLTLTSVIALNAATSSRGRRTASSTMHSSLRSPSSHCACVRAAACIDALPAPSWVRATAAPGLTGSRMRDGSGKASLMAPVAALNMSVTGFDSMRNLRTWARKPSMMSPASSPSMVFVSVFSLSPFAFLDLDLLDRRAFFFPFEFLGDFLSLPHLVFFFFFGAAKCDIETVVATPEVDLAAASCWDTTRVLLMYMWEAASTRAGCAESNAMCEFTTIFSPFTLRPSFSLSLLRPMSLRAASAAGAPVASAIAALSICFASCFAIVSTSLS